MNKSYLKFFVASLIILLSLALLFWKYHLLYTEQKTEQQLHSLVNTEDKSPLPLPPKNKALILPILMYHHIGEPPKNASKVRKQLTVSVENFKNQIQWLKKQGYNTIKLIDIYNFYLGKIALPNKPIILTFDDGYDDAFVNAIPILDQNGFIGSFAIITTFPHAKIGDNFYASWEEIITAYKTGHEIVSHTQDHFDGKNKKYSNEFVKNNLASSIYDLNDKLGFTTKVLIYPYGHYTPEYIKIAKEQGFVLGITVHEGYTINTDNFMEIPRLRVNGNLTQANFEKMLEKAIDTPSTSLPSLLKK